MSIRHSILNRKLSNKLELEGEDFILILSLALNYSLNLTLWQIELVVTNAIIKIWNQDQFIGIANSDYKKTVINFSKVSHRAIQK